jgi:hypothetical protein
MTDPSLASVEQFAEHLRDHVRGGGNVYPFAVGMISGVVTSFHRGDARKLDDVRDILTALSQVTNEIMTSPAHDSEVTQPLAERPLVGDGGVWAVPVAGDPPEVDPPEGFVPASASIVQLTHLLWISGTTACGLGPERQLGLSLTTVQTGVTCQACVDEMPF